MESPTDTQVKVKHGYKDTPCDISLTNRRVVGNGTFGVVHGALLNGVGPEVAIKKVFQDSRYKNRELQIMKMLQHPNIISLLYYYKYKNSKGKVYLHLIMDCYPETVFDLIRSYKTAKQKISHRWIKLFSYQMLRGLAFMHSKEIVHRDIKTTNLLIDKITGILKICDFGSAKMLISGQANVAYICSRYYRAPELIIGAVNYSYPIDVWSAGCVIGEMALTYPIFAGETSTDQLLEIVKIIGPPTQEQLMKMNPHYERMRIPRRNPITLAKLYSNERDESYVNLLSVIFDFNPQTRCTSIESLIHPYFDDLRDPNYRLNVSMNLTDLFHFTDEELRIKPTINHLLIKHNHNSL